MGNKITDIGNRDKDKDKDKVRARARARAKDSPLHSPLRDQVKKCQLKELHPPSQRVTK